VLGVLLGIGAVGLRARLAVVRTDDAGASAAFCAAYTVILVYFMVDWAWEVPALVLLGVGGMAVTGAAAFPRLASSKRPSPALRWAAVAAALVLGATQVPSLVATERVRASAQELQSGSLEPAAELAQESIDAADWAASGYVQRGLVAEEAGDLDAAKADFDEALEREPTNWRHHLLLARLAARRGDARTMRRELSEARKLAPDSPFLFPQSPYQMQLQELLSAAP
jgi:tetratricopeptide (TPR) repeat protein